MAANKKTYHPDFRKFAQNGDRVLDAIVNDIFRNEHGKVRGSMTSFFKCNAALVNFRRPFKLKKKYKNPLKVADEVEAYIWFLDINYGREASRRYVCKEMRRIRDMIPVTIYTV